MKPTLERPPSFWVAGTASASSKEDVDAKSVDAQFEVMMERKAMPLAVREMLRTMETKKKMVLLAQETAVTEIKDAEEDKEEDVVQYWLDLLNGPFEELSQTMLYSLRARLGGENREWLEEFIDNGGFDSLLIVSNTANQKPIIATTTTKDNKAESSTIQFACFLCIKVFVASDIGLEYLIQTEQQATSFAYSLISAFYKQLNASSLEFKKEIIALLTYTCWKIGSLPILKAFTNHSFDLSIPRFFSLLYCLKSLPSNASEADVDFLGYIMTLINGLISTLDDISERVRLRREFLSMNIIGIENTLRMQLDGTAHTSAFQRLDAQLEVFHAEMDRDKEFHITNLIDISDPDAIFTCLKENTLDDGVFSDFVDILGNLLSIPSDRLVSPALWKQSSWAIRRVTTPKKEEEEISSYSSFTELKEQISTPDLSSFEKAALEQKIEELNSKLKEAKENNDLISAELRSTKIQIRTYEENLAKKEAEISSSSSVDEIISVPDSESGLLKNDIGNTPILPPPMGNIPPPPPMGGIPPPCPPMGGIPPPPCPPMGGIPPPCPPMGGIPPPPPIGGPPPCPPMGGIPPPPPMGGPPPCPPIGGGPPPPPPMGGTPAVFAAAPIVPTKPIIKPNKKMKTLFWQSMKATTIAGTVWEDFPLEDIEIDSVDDFEEKFQAKASRNLSKTASSSSDSTKKKSEKVELEKILDSRVAQNTDIATRRLGKSHEAIRNALIVLDEKWLDIEKISSIKSLYEKLGDGDELQRIEEFTGPIEKLRNAERFYKTLSEIPYIKIRLDLILFKLLFELNYSELINKINIISKTSKNIISSEKFKRLLRIILSFGNYMNGNTAKGGAFGFKISTLLKLSNSKSIDGKITLLGYLTKYIHTYDEDTLLFINDLNITKQAALIESNQLISEVKNIKERIKKLGNALENKFSEPFNDLDRFPSIMTDFYAIACEKQQELNSKFLESQELSYSTIKYFNENQNMPYEELYQILSNFIIDFEKADKSMKEVEKKEMIAKKRAEHQEWMESNLSKRRKAMRNDDEEEDEEDNEDFGITTTTKKDSVGKFMKGLFSKNPLNIISKIRQRRDDKKHIDKQVTSATDDMEYINKKKQQQITNNLSIESNIPKLARTVTTFAERYQTDRGSKKKTAPISFRKYRNQITSDDDQKKKKQNQDDNDDINTPITMTITVSNEETIYEKENEIFEEIIQEIIHTENIGRENIILSLSVQDLKNQLIESNSIEEIEYLKGILRHELKRCIQKGVVTNLAAEHEKKVKSIEHVDIMNNTSLTSSSSSSPRSNSVLVANLAAEHEKKASNTTTVEVTRVPSLSPRSPRSRKDKSFISNLAAQHMERVRSASSDTTTTITPSIPHVTEKKVAVSKVGIPRERKVKTRLRSLTEAGAIADGLPPTNRVKSEKFSALLSKFSK